MNFAIKTERLDSFLNNVKSIVSKDTYIQENDFKDVIISSRGLFAQKSGMVQVEIKGKTEDINKMIKIFKDYQ